MVKKVLAFLTTDDLGDYETDDHLAAAPLRELGWDVDWCSWRRPTDWSRYAGVVIRTPWDYIEDEAGFRSVLASIDAATRLANPLSVVRWNLNKSYLKELIARRLPVLPSRWFPELTSAQQLDALFEHWGVEELVVKPELGANAYDTYRLKRGGQPPLDRFRARPCLVQPFATEILSQGEYSLFYFGGRFSHAIRKLPRAGDFRVQEEHGGQLNAITPDESLRNTAERLLAAVANPLLYARVDLVSWANEYRLMELELVEPSLYLRLDPAAAARFAAAIDRWFPGA
ncbi:MAG: hypothetical protein AAGA23_09840 [Pseudomonadota bacterium]